MNLAFTLLAMLLQVTPAPTPTAPPSPPPLVTPAPSSSVTPSESPSPAASPSTLAAQPAAVNLHPSQAQAVTITNSTGTLTASLDTPIATVSIDQIAHSVTLTASQQTGNATLTIGDGSGASLQVPVRVAYDAGVVPATLTVRVTGDTFTPQWLQAQIQKALLKVTQVQPGANVTLGTFTLPTLLAPGAIADVPVPVQIPGGSQYFDVNAVSTVTLQNVPAAPFFPPLLYYDDDPEKIVADGVLYQNQIAPGTPVRLYYYHQNSTDPRRLLIVVSTTSQNDPSTVQLIDASAGPNIDVMSVGHAVSRDFLAAEPHNQGIVVDVPPNAPYIADEFAMQRLDGAAGSVGFRVLGGGAVTVTVLAVPNTVSDAQIAQYLSQSRLPGDGHHRTGAFTLTGYANETLAYTVGGPDATTQYGATTPPAADGTGRDYGDYGVLRFITFEVTNPGQQPASVYLYEEPMGGPVRSSFLVDGVLDQVGCARVSQRYQIGDPITVNPGASRIVVQTMTDGGSNYPLGVGITTNAPLPVTPAITAPDGCFPKPQATAAPNASPEPSPSTSPPPSPAPEPTG